MPDGVLVGHGRVLKLFQASLVLQVGVGEHDVASTMRLRKHGLEFDFGEAPLRIGRLNVLPHVRDVRLTIAGPPLGARTRCSAHDLGKAVEIRPVRRSWTRTRLTRRSNRWLCRRRALVICGLG